MGFTTKALHAKPAHKDQHGAMRFPIYQSSAFEFEKAEDLEAVFKGQWNDTFSLLFIRKYFKKIFYMILSFI